MARKATKPAEAAQTAEATEMEAKAEDIQTEEKVAESAKEEPKKTPGRKRTSKKEADQADTGKTAGTARTSKKEAGQADADMAAGKEDDQKEADLETGKSAARTSAAKKAGQQCSLYVQYGGRSLSQDDLLNIAKDVWKYDLKQKTGDLKNVDLYVKPEENKVYYVMNGEFTGSFDI